MGKLINLETCVGPYVVLFQQEEDVIVELVSEYLIVHGDPNEGTFILDGQKYGDDAKCLIRFNLRDGVFRQRFFRTYEKTSDTMAEEAIDHALLYPAEKSRYVGSSGPRPVAEMASGIYQDGELKVLVLNATYGRFLCSFYVNWNDGGHEQSTKVLLFVSEVLAQLCKKDTVLQESNRSVWAEARKHARLYYLKERVAEEFATCRLPALKARKEWLELVNSSGELPLFFK